MTDRRTIYLANLKPKKDEIRFMIPGRCSGSWLDPESKGCGHIVRIHYMVAPRGSRRWKKALPKAAGCPICGCLYPFAFYKLKQDDAYQPGDEEERDIRLLHLDLNAMAKGKDPSYDLPLEDRVRIHCLQHRRLGECRHEKAAT